MTTDRVTARREAAARALVLFETAGACDHWPTWCGQCDCGRDVHADDYASQDREHAQAALAAADEWDRANGYVTVKLDDGEFYQRFRQAVHEQFERGHCDLDQCLSTTDHLISVLRESAERETNR